ncbi:SDR family oxidoreductase [Acidipila sp. EB88]|uniref:SDR family oxidoreductase n=1 Tax=Acidipila sp. EB88 TaxID=2305226 RepID=UPI000F5F4B37|nr:SDR family oxidoreductase [Acidipila sp. EB88]RRA48522.1 SDR family oxidoreductase [Acidipila sp. EB88]
MTEQTQGKTALVVGSTGITGGNLAAHLSATGWEVLGLARRPGKLPGITPVAADLTNRASVVTALRNLAPTHVFYGTWLRNDTEAENVRVNGGMMQTLFDALAETGAPIQHAALVTGTKQYLGPFEAYGQTAAETPFREDNPRLPGLNFYYTQEDILFAAAARSGFTWSVHRPHSIVGFAVGNAMNMGVTLAVYATLCREYGEPFVFPGSHFQWNAITDVTDARLLARHLAWAATTPAAANTAFNIVNGDVFRWRWLWSQLAAYFGVEPQGPPVADGTNDGRDLLTPKLAVAGERWSAIAAKYGLAEPNMDALASAWHTDGDLGRELECLNDMHNSRVRGFTEYQPTLASFTELFDELRARKLIPA